MNDNLSPNMSTLAFNARVLKRKKLIADTWFSNAAVRVKTLDNRTVKVTHEIDLFELCPDFDGFSFDTDIFRSPDSDDRDMERYNSLEGAWPGHFPPPVGRKAEDDVNHGNFETASNFAMLLNSLQLSQGTTEKRDMNVTFRKSLK